jgi:proton glutamate symport protein
MMLTLMITSKGVAAVPRAALVILSATLATFGLPLEGVAIILGVDSIMDMARTSTNLVGNCLATVVMARWEGEFASPQPGVLHAQEQLLPGEPAPPARQTSGAVPSAS